MFTTLVVYRLATAGAARVTASAYDTGPCMIRVVCGACCRLTSWLGSPTHCGKRWMISMAISMPVSRGQPK
ncbi:hypothetical protein D3C80_1665380 [compost metagenome]